ncbi:MAG: hypothetical protein WB995_07580 [Candidatus Acidiferrales bacterium]
MNDDDRKFEAFLSEFKPRRPRPLPQAESTSHSWPRLAAAAALILAVGGVSLWIGRPRIQKMHNDGQPAGLSVIGAAANHHQPISTISLTRAALEGSPDFDREMNDMAQRSLPRFDRKDSMLRVLAKE